VPPCRTLYSNMQVCPGTRTSASLSPRLSRRMRLLHTSFLAFLAREGGVPKERARAGNLAETRATARNSDRDVPGYSLSSQITPGHCTNGPVRVPPTWLEFHLASPSRGATNLVPISLELEAERNTPRFPSHCLAGGFQE